jgi:hypothetical protein
MGSSGGGRGYYVPRTEQQTESSIQASRRATENADYEAAVSERLQDLLAAYNDRDTDAINARLEQVRESLVDYLESSVDLRFGGSVSKHTYVDGISDVDCLCFLDPSKFTADSPQQLLREFEAVLKRVMGARADVERGALSIKITFKDGPQLQILPALRTASGVRIPSAEENTWSQVVHPQRFAQALTDLNQRLSGKVVPVIKLVKPAITKLYPKIKGYHVEVLVERIFQDYRGDLTSKAMAQHFFDRASEMVKTPIRDTTGQSVYADDYLGGRNSAEREALNSALRTIAQRMREADAGHSVNGWLRSIEAE